MNAETTYQQAQQDLPDIIDHILSHSSVMYIKGRSDRSVAMLPASELEGLLETIHLLKSPRNAQRLMSAIDRARAGANTPQSPEQLRKEFGLDEE